MIMADVLFWLLIAVGFYLVFVSYWVAAEALFPAFVERCRLRYAQKPYRSTLWGLLAAAPLLAGALFLLTHMGNPLLQISGVGVVALMVIFGLVGSAGLCRQIGRGLAKPDDAAQPWRQVRRGAIVLAMTFVLPVIGWFVVLPWVLISGLGVFLRVRFTRKAAA